MFQTKFVENFMLYNFSNNSKCHLKQRKRDISKKPVFVTFDLEYLDSRTRDSMRLLSQLIKCQNKDIYKFVAYYLSFQGLPLFSPYMTVLLEKFCSIFLLWLFGQRVWNFIWYPIKPECQMLFCFSKHREYSLLLISNLAWVPNAIFFF